MRKLSTEALFDVNGGYRPDHGLGYKIGKAASWVCDKVTGAWNKVFG